MPRRPNVIVLVLDSVRYDRTSVGDHHRDTTPNLQRIADRADGASFENGIAHAKHTSKSSASILTGKYPAEHRFGYESACLDPGIPTVAGAFHDAGYATICITNNGFVREEGAGRDFETYELLPKRPLELLRTVGPIPSLKFLANIRRHSAGFQRDIHRHSGAYLMASLVDQHLEALESQSDPFFLYAHYNQPHRAYYPPLAWFDTYADAFEMSTYEAGEFSMDVHHNLTQKVAEGCPFTDDEWAALKALYDTEIKYTDTFVGELFDRVQRCFDDTVFIVTADHGEHFGEHGALAHRYVLDDALLNVPLVTTGLEPKSTSAPVQHSDVMYTVLEMAGADDEFVDGIDLRTETRDFAVSQDSEMSLEPILEHNPEFDGTKFFPGAEEMVPERTTIRTEQYRYVRGADGTEALYELPDESVDVSSERPEVVDKLNAKLEEWFAKHEQAQMNREGNDHGDLTEATKSRLRDMGYLEEDL